MQFGSPFRDGWPEIAKISRQLHFSNTEAASLYGFGDLYKVVKFWKVYLHQKIHFLAFLSSPKAIVAAAHEGRFFR